MKNVNQSIIFQTPYAAVQEPELPDGPDTMQLGIQASAAADAGSDPREQLTSLATGQTIAYLAKGMTRFSSLELENRLKPLKWLR